MLQNLKKRTEGFTIIEVMIVLVIAAVILLIVFLAVPALQRNSRNTQRNSDVSNLLGAAGEAAGQSNGTYPTAAGGYTGLTNLGFYQTANVSVLNTVPSANTNASTEQTVIIVPNAKCDPATANKGVVASNRTIAIMYTLESNVKACKDS